jgi:hypothetical protein
MKRCKHCGETKPLDAFYADRAARDGRRPECKSCTSARRMAAYRANSQREIQRVLRWQQENRERYNAKQRAYKQSHRAEQREEHLRRTFNLTQADYERMLAEQGGACAICGRKPRPSKHLHVDHDHDTGRVRGLLCFSCNVGVGNFHHDMSRLARARDYLDDDAERANDLALVRERVRSLVRVGSD